MVLFRSLVCAARKSWLYKPSTNESIANTDVGMFRTVVPGLTQCWCFRSGHVTIVNTNSVMKSCNYELEDPIIV